MGDEVSHLINRISELVIGLYTDDFSLIHDLTRELSRRNVTVLHYNVGEAVVDKVDSIVVGKEDPKPVINISNTPVVRIMDEPYSAADRAIAAGMGRYRPDRLTIGIDPGARPGIAFIADGLLIKTESAPNISEVRKIIRCFVKAVDPGKTIIRIGKGDPANRDSIIALLDGIGIPIEIVDERWTTRGTKYRDQNAAVKIARDSGESGIDATIK